MGRAPASGAAELVLRNVAKLVRVKTPEYSVGKGLPADRSNRAR
ncbi:hypothetical protein Ae168Ps1_1902c [Pseudonocardia sp. Ae168_Ps1]|nr:MULTISPECIES: hypothetical protein [unclassified Pseudonocardia]OLL73525.1 hypothetical protein Ae150APs1_1903c [Pseudonocardia sp. Ae150A_Ps1]OLL79496.1 hypothetical protein Ae168Ps1_1902c [Pseudonocardia sp. Ae168_Ps1]OLL86364.1 hypothetical protein Ae263Ps1_3419 [Pseudonocardia sp. Ae263_Ps1]